MKKIKELVFFKNIVVFVISMFSLLVLTKCQIEDAFLNNGVHKLPATSQKVSFEQINCEINNPIIKKYLSKVNISNELQRSSRLYDQVFFNKIIKENDYDTYTLPINKFSLNEPLFEFFIITKKNDKENACVVKYIPTEHNPILNVKNFTGTIEIYTISDELYAKSNFINGQVVATTSNNNARMECVNSTVISTITCSNGGGHIPGQSCNNGAVNDSYYQVSVRVTCKDFNTLTPPDSFMGQSGGGGGGPSTPEEASFYTFLDSLTEDQRTIVTQNQSIVNYLMQNDTDEARAFVREALNAVLNQLNIFGNTFVNNQIINDFINKVLNGDNDINNSPSLPVQPSSLSFNFVNTNSNWQEAAVTNIYFQIALISPEGIHFTHIVNNPQAILFGCPRNLAVGNTTISASMAAIASAHALGVSMSETARKYGNKPVSDNIVNLYFQSRLRYNYSLFLPGGRVNINPTNYSVTPTPYISN